MDAKKTGTDDERGKKEDDENRPDPPLKNIHGELVTYPKGEPRAKDKRPDPEG